MIRYLPAKGTAGLARTADKIDSRSPSPPARTTAVTRFTRSMLHRKRKDETRRQPQVVLKRAAAPEASAESFQFRRMDARRYPREREPTLGRGALHVGI